MNIDTRFRGLRGYFLVALAAVVLAFAPVAQNHVVADSATINLTTLLSGDPATGYVALNLVDVGLNDVHLEVNTFGLTPPEAVKTILLGALPDNGNGWVFTELIGGPVAVSLSPDGFTEGPGPAGDIKLEFPPPDFGPADTTWLFDVTGPNASVANFVGSGDDSDHIIRVLLANGLTGSDWYGEGPPPPTGDPIPEPSTWAAIGFVGLIVGRYIYRRALS